MTLRLPGVLGLLVIPLCLGWLAPGKAHAQTLEEALKAAYQNNPTLLAQRARLRATDEKVPQALSNWRPTVEVTGSAGTSGTTSKGGTSSGSTVLGGQHLEPRSVGVTLTQPLFRGGRTIAATSGAENTVRAERARLLKTEQDVMLSAATAFVDVFRDEAVLKLNVNNEQVLKRQLEATRDRFEVGEITRTDVHQAQARLAKATADRIRAEGDLEVSRATYQKVVGVPSPRNLKAPAVPPVQPATQDAAVKLAAINNPDVVGAEFDKLAQLDTVDAVRGELLPTVSVSTSLTRELESSTEDRRVDTAEIKLNVTVPLYQQGAVYSRLREAKQTAAERLHAIDRARRESIEAATRAWETLASASAQVKAFKSQIEANVVALEGVEREAQVGSRTVLDVLDAEQELLDSRVAHVRSQRDELVAFYQLKAAMGQLTAREMKLPVDLYDPMGHYQEVRDKWFGTTGSGGTE
jgi:outer membrane protein